MVPFMKMEMLTISEIMKVAVEEGIVHLHLEDDQDENILEGQVAVVEKKKNATSIGVEEEISRKIRVVR